MYIGIDLGTTGVKVILVDKDGNVINSVTENYELLTPKPLWTEQNPEIWYNSTLEALKNCIRGYEERIKALSFSGQMHGLVILDKDDRVIRPAILWNDQRTIVETNEINNSITVEKLILETGNIALTGFTAPKILWVKNNEFKNFKNIRKIMLPKDYLVYKLTNKFVTDVTDISGSLLFNVENKIYSQTILDFLGINIKQLPKVLESNEVIGFIDKTILEELNIKNDVKVIVGGGDQAIGAIGTGTVNDGDINISLGTSGVVFVASDKYSVDKKSFIHSFAHANNKYHLMGVTLAAAGSFKWWKESFLPNKSYNEIFDDLVKTDIDDSIYYLPYISGERSPINNPLAKGTFCGFTSIHKIENFSRAVIEGVVYSLRHCYEVIKGLNGHSNQIRITGGGSKNDHWCQMVADIFNIEVQKPRVTEGSSLGAAIMAMVGDGLYKNVTDACRDIVKVEKEFIPNEKNVLIYQKKYACYLQLYENIKPFFT
mgnify:CR=1 FL=1